MFKVSNKEFQPHTISCGFSHSCAINKNGQLLFWGDNSVQQLYFESIQQKSEKNKPPDPVMKLVKTPTYINLKYEAQAENLRALQKYEDMKKNKDQFFEGLRAGVKYHSKSGCIQYRAIDVDCGNNCTFVIGEQIPKTFIECLEEYPENHEIKDILSKLRDILERDKTFVDLFEIHENQDDDIDDPVSKKNEFRDEESIQDPFCTWVDTDQFKEIIKVKLNIKAEKKIDELARLISEHRVSRGGQQQSSLQEKLNLGDIEDFALGFLQHNVKLFAFGQIHKTLGAFENKVLKHQEVKKEALKSNDINLQNQGQTVNDIIIISKPTAIQFPKFTKPIIAVACGASHALAITINNNMYSWGSGSYGALGFGSMEDQPTPKHVPMNDPRGVRYIIIQVACGKYHSICLTRRKAIFTWGTGTKGRLGQGNQEDQLKPKEIKGLSEKKPIFIAAGESNSAAITEKLNLYTWGNGSFGRLGHNLDIDELTPKMVDDLSHEEIDYVSLGENHSMALTKQGVMYSWGQNKYNKLGVDASMANEGDVLYRPKEVYRYRISPNLKDLERDDTDKVVGVFCGNNHSMALTQDGLAYSWGYSGKNLLGRVKNHNQCALPIGTGFKGPPQFKLTCNTGLAEFIKKYMQDQIKMNQQMQKGDNQKKQKEVVESNESFQNYLIDQVYCGQAHTIALSNTGDVFVIGDNLYGQHGREQLDEATAIIQNQIERPIPKTDNDPNEQQIMDDYEKESSIYGFCNISKVEFPFLKSDKIVQISCGSNHIFVKTNLDEIYGWGKNDEGQLGAGFLTEKFVNPTKIDGLSYKGIKQIACSDNYSAGLSIYGDVFVAGSLDGGKLGLGRGLRKGYQLDFTQVSNLTIPEIEFISCGESHMLVISKFNPNAETFPGQPKQEGKIYAWGKNHRGQLGVGNKDNQYSPKAIESAQIQFKKVACGINFSVGLTKGNKLYWWGNKKYSGDSNRKEGDADEPKKMDKLDNQEVLDVVVNCKKCIALMEDGTIRQWGEYLIDKHINDNQEGEQDMEQKLNFEGFDENFLDYKSPTKKRKKQKKPPHDIKMFPIQDSGGSQSFKKLSTSQNHSTGISTNGKVFIWGHNNVNNKLGLQNQKQTQNCKFKPVVLTFLEKAIQKQKEQNDAEQQQNLGGDNDKKSPIKNKSSQGKTGAKLEQINEEESDEQIQQQEEQIDVDSIKMDMEDSDENEDEEDQGQQDAQEGQEMIQEEQIDLTQQIVEEIRKFNEKNPKRSRKQQLSIFDATVNLYVLEFLRQSIHKKQHPIKMQISKLTQQTGLIDVLILLQKVLKREEFQSLDEKSITNLDQKALKQTSKILMEVLQCSKFQKENLDVLIKAKTSFSGRVVEMPFNLDPALAYSLKQQGKDQDLSSSKKQIQKLVLYLQIHPCYIVNILKSNLLDFSEQKMLIKQLFKSKNKNQADRYNYLLISIFEEVFKYDCERQYAEANKDDEKELTELESVDITKDTISFYIFRRIFKQNQTNLDTICCIIGHMCNYCMLNYNQGQGNHADTTLDILGEGDEMNQEEKKGGKVNSTPEQKKQRQKELVDFLRNLTYDMKNNTILKEQGSQYFTYKHQTYQQLDFVQKQIQISKQRQKGWNRAETSETKGLSDIISPDDVKSQFPTFRFSGEVFHLINIMYQRLKNLKCPSDKQDNLICNNIIGIVFGVQAKKILENIQLYMMPYIAKIKMVSFIMEQLTRMQTINIKNAIKIFISFTTGQNFQDDSNSASGPPQSNSKNPQMQELNNYVKDLRDMERTNILNILLQQGKEISHVQSYKNFNNMVIHSLEQDDSQICINKKLLGKLVQVIKDNQQAVSTQQRKQNDPLIQIINLPQEEGGINISAVAAMASDSSGETVSLKLKTRLFVNDNFDNSTQRQQEEIINKFVRCKKCHAILHRELAISNFDECLVLNQYEPQDRGQLSTQFCEILKTIPPIDKDLLNPSGGKDKSAKKKHSISLEIIELAFSAAKRNGKQQDMVTMIANFRKQFKGEILSYTSMNKNSQDNAKDNNRYSPIEQLSDEDKVAYQLIKQAEQKIHEREKQKFNLGLIQQEIDRYLLPQISLRIDSFKQDLIKQAIKIQQNYQFGLANRDFIHMTEDPVLVQMQKVKGFNSSQPRSKILSQNLKGGNKDAIRGFLQLEAGKMMENGTIAKINLKEMTDLIRKSHMCLIECDSGQNIEFKLVFRETKFNICGPDKVMGEQILLRFEIKPTKIKQIRQQIAIEQANKFKNKELKDGETPQKDEAEETKNLVFEENDALEFNAEKFMALLTQMERQKAAYAVLDDDKPKSKGKKKGKGIKKE